MAIKLGPVLGFRGLRGGKWQVSALIVVGAGEAAPKVTVDGKAAAAKNLGTYPDNNPSLEAFRYDFEAALGPQERSIKYQVEGLEEFSFVAPAAGAIPQCVYASCNGFSSLKLMNRTANANALWDQVAKKHERQAYHLLLMGGDQVYADSIWDAIPELHEWGNLKLEKRLDAKFTQALARKTEEFYASLYPKRWTQPEVRKMMASIPTIMMWDDHDIFDGWGSHEGGLQDSPIFQGLFKSARKYFALYQLQLAPDERHPAAIPGQDAFSLGFTLGPLAIAAIDMRSERSPEQVIKFESWKGIYDWFDGIAKKPGATPHVFVMTSIPVIYPDFSVIEQTLGILPGVQEIEDDLKDHWNSRPHKEERLRMIHRLLNFAADAKARVTLLSGDVHVAALGLVRSTRALAGDADPPAQLLTQLTSSGIVHPPPPGVVLYFLESVMGKKTEEDRDITSEMAPFPGTRTYYIGSRNWLSLEGDGEKRIWAHWYVEGEDHPFTKVIHPPGYNMQSAKVPVAADVE